MQVSAILDPNGKPQRILSVSRDITQLKEAEVQNALLAQELVHRIKNVITMVQSIALQTLKPGVANEDARRILLDRIHVLGEAQDLLVQSTGGRAWIGDIVGAAIKPFADADRISIAGPAIEIASKCAFAMALAVNELATNAVKYGALSNETGRVDIQWTIDVSVKPQGFSFHWAESGGPPTAPPTRTGFGSRMIEQALAGYFRGRVSLCYPSEGVRYALEAPLQALIED